MCNAYGLTHPLTRINQRYAEAQVPLIFPTGLPNLEARERIAPTDPAPIVRAAEGGFEFVSLRWGFQPGRPKAGPVINFRSEGRRFGSGRCLIPASYFYEFTGARAPKSMWEFSSPDGEIMAIAGLCRPTVGDWPDSFTMLTVEPGPDVAPHHDRQIVVLAPDRWRDWLDGSAPEAEVLRPSPAGSFRVRQVR